MPEFGYIFQCLTMLKPIFRCAVLAAAAASSASAFAYSSAAAAVDNLQFSVVDLDRDDGKEAYGRFLSNSPSGTASNYFSVTGPLGEYPKSSSLQTGMDGLVQYTMEGRAPDGSVEGVLTMQRNAASLHANAQGDTTSYFLRVMQQVRLEVSPRSRLSLSVTGSAALSVGNSHCGPEAIMEESAGPCSEEYATGRAEVYVYAMPSPDGLYYDSFIFFDKFDVSATTGAGELVTGPNGELLPDPGGDMSKSHSKTWSMTFDNPSSKSMEVLVSLRASVLGGAMSPVPEPMTVPLFFAGVMTLAARRGLISRQPRRQAVAPQ